MTYATARAEDDRPILLLALVLSVLLHFGFERGLYALPRPAPRIEEDHLVEMVAIVEQTPPPVAEEPEPEPEAEPELAPPPPERPRALPRAPREPQPKEPPAPAEETVADFSGLVLSGQGNSGFQVQQGNETDRPGPIGKPNAVPTGRNREGTPGGAVGGTGEAVVAAGDLSARPSPPSASYDAYLHRNFPQEARSRNVGGTALVSLTIGSDGKPRNIRVRRESPEGFGFGDVCAQMFRAGPTWTPPRDKNGNPVATTISFECNFNLKR
jgi:periplasmic protein TonB